MNKFLFLPFPQPAYYVYYQNRKQGFIFFSRHQFNEHIIPYLSKAQRRYVCSIPHYKIFNYILYRLHTGCQWERISLKLADPHNLQKKRAAGRLCITICSDRQETQKGVVITARLSLTGALREDMN